MRTTASAMFLLILSSMVCRQPPAVQADDPTALKASAVAESPADAVEEPKLRKAKKDKDHAENKEAREQRVMAFVQKQNPELAKVLTHLKKRKPHEYDKAVHDLARTVTILTNAKSRDDRLYELELKAWQAKTRVEMLDAQSMVGKKEDKEALQVKLREAVSEELKLKAEELAYRKDKSAAWYDRQIERINKHHDEAVEARLKKLLGEKAGKPKGKRSGKAD